MKSDLNFYLDIRSIKHGFKNTAGSFELDERLCEIENQIEQDNRRKRDLQATYWKKEGKRRPSMQFDIAKIQSMVEQKISWEKIADAFGVSDHCMRGFAKKNGIYVTISSGARRKIHIESGKLKALIDQGLTWQEIGKKLSVSKQLVISRAIELGLSKQTKRFFIDTEKLKGLVEQGLSWIKIGRLLGVSDYTAHRRASELGFIKQYTKRKKSDADQLKILVEQGLNWMEIGKVLGVSHVSARERANRLGIFKQDNRRKTSE
jgi:hypothetical protein